MNYEKKFKKNSGYNSYDGDAVGYSSGWNGI